MFICQNSEGVQPYLLKCCRDTCSFVGMVKGYILRKRMGTPALVIRYLARQLHSNINKLFSERTPSLLFINLTCEWLFWFFITLIYYKRQFCHILNILDLCTAVVPNQSIAVYWKTAECSQADRASCRKKIKHNFSLQWLSFAFKGVVWCKRRFHAFFSCEIVPTPFCTSNVTWSAWSRVARSTFCREDKSSREKSQILIQGP